MTARGSSSIADEPISTTTGSQGQIGAESGMSGEQQHPLVEAGQEAGESVGMLAERATNIGFQQADRAREQAANGIEQVTESIRRISLDMEGEQPAIANVASTAADQAERVAQYLRTTDAREILGTVENLARRQPLVFLGGAFVLGLAVSRFIKAAGGPSGGTGQSQSRGSQWGQSGWQGQGWQSGTGFQATGPGSRGTNGMTGGDERLAEGI